MGTFFGGPVIKTLSFHSIEHGSIPDQGTKIPHVMWQKKKKAGEGGAVEDSGKTLEIRERYSLRMKNQHSGKENKTMMEKKIMKK